MVCSKALPSFRNDAVAATRYVKGMHKVPSLSGIHHLSLSVSNVTESIDWYCQLLGFELLSRRTQAELDKALIRHRECELVISLVGHGEFAVAADFNERRTGLDHVGFAVENRAELTAWAQHLENAGVAHDGITSGSSGDLVAFRDPDNIALEFYTK